MIWNVLIPDKIESLLVLRVGLIVVACECLTVLLRKLQNSFVVMLLSSVHDLFYSHVLFCFTKN